MGKSSRSTRAGFRRAEPQLAAWKLWLFRLAAVLGSPVLFLLAVEILLRLFGYGFPVGYFVSVSGRNYVVTNDRFPYRFFPPSLVRSPVLDIVEVPKPQSQLRIFLLGGSAARGTPDPAFSVGRFLEVLLEERFPGADFRVINAAMTAINSHVVREIAWDCASLEPDYFVVYCGNNEVVGPYGPGTVFQSVPGSITAIRAAVLLRKLKLGQLLSDCASLLGVRSGTGGTWRGLALFQKNKVPLWDPRLALVYRAYRSNLEAVCRAARSAGATTLLCTVPVNLKDCSPFASVHRKGLSPEKLKAWNEAFQRGKEALARGDARSAVEAFRKALALEDGFAELHYQLGRALLRAGEEGKAGEHFQKACDLDALRFRADSRLNRIVKEVGSKLRGETVRLVDTEEAFRRVPETRAGIPGHELFYEHVHLNVRGRYLFARAVAEALAGLLPSKFKSRDRGRWPDLPRCRKLLGLSERQELRMLETIIDMVEKPPFTEQSIWRLELERLKQQASRLRVRASGVEALQADIAGFKDLLKRNGRDLLLLQKLSETLGEAGRYQEAIEELEKLRALVPGVARWELALGRLLRDSGKKDRAEAAFKRAIDLRPKSPEAYKAYLELGDLALESGDPASAYRFFRGALRVSPDSYRAWARLGAALSAEGRLAEAEKAFREALKLLPTYAEAYYNLAAIAARQGHLKEAQELLEKALRLNPDLPEAQQALGKLLEHKGELQKARAHFLRARALKPNLPGIEKDLERLARKLGPLRR